MKTPNLHQRLNLIRSEVGSIQKDGYNDSQRYKFAQDPDVLERVRSLMVKHGVSLKHSYWIQSRHERQTRSGSTFIYDTKHIFDLINADDPQDREEYDWVAQGMDSGDKALNKAATAAEKYFLLKQFMIPTRDKVDDSDYDQDSQPPLNLEATKARAKGNFPPVQQALPSGNGKNGKAKAPVDRGDAAKAIYNGIEAAEGLAELMGVWNAHQDVYNVLPQETRAILLDYYMKRAIPLATNNKELVVGIWSPCYDEYSTILEKNVRGAIFRAYETRKKEIKANLL